MYRSRRLRDLFDSDHSHYAFIRRCEIVDRSCNLGGVQASNPKKPTSTISRSMVGSFYTVALAMLLIAAPCQASPIITFIEKNKHQRHQQNVLFNQSGGTGTTVTGTTNQSSTTVSFYSSSQTLHAHGGQAKITAVSGNITNIKIYIPGGSYTSLIINPFNGGTPAGMAHVAVDWSKGNLSGEVDSSYSLVNGNNFLTIIAASGVDILSTTLSVPDGFQELKHVRIVVAPGNNGGVTTVPEPSSIVLMGVMVVGLVASQWYTQRKRRVLQRPAVI